MGEANTYRHNYPIARVVQVFRNPSDGLVRNVEVTFRGILKKLTHVASLQFLPLGQYGLCFGYCFSGLLTLHSHKGRGYLLGACFRESLVIRLYSETGQIHLSIEAQCGSPVYLRVREKGPRIFSKDQRGDQLFGAFSAISFYL